MSWCKDCRTFHTRVGIDCPTPAEIERAKIESLLARKPAAPSEGYNCQATLRTGDGISVGKCYRWIKPGEYCPYHGETGKP